MFRLIIFGVLTGCLGITDLTAQSIRRQVLGSVGAIQSSGNFLIHSTFGQPPNAGTITDGNNFLRQGFQQPFDFEETPPDESDIYDIITPNGDGVNDFWVVENIADFPNNELVIFNRWGNKVFEISSYNNTWDGRNDSGEFLPSATYYYILKLNNSTGTVYSGHIDVIR